MIIQRIKYEVIIHHFIIRSQGTRLHSSHSSRQLSLQLMSSLTHQLLHSCTPTRVLCSSKLLYRSFKHRRALSVSANRLPNHSQDGQGRNRGKSCIYVTMSFPLAPNVTQSRGQSLIQTQIKSFSTSSSKKEENDTEKDRNVSPIEDTSSSHSDKTTSPQDPFPWRASATEPLDRILADDDLSGLTNDTKSRYAKRYSTGFELGASAWQVFFTKRWEYDLAEHASWAFTMGVSGLLSRVFGVCIWDIENTSEGGLALDTASTTEQTGEKNKNEEEDQDETFDSSEFIASMLQDNLLKIYQSVPTDQDNKPYRIRFFMKPIESRLQNAFLIPSLTREDVQQDASLQGMYTGIERAYRESKDMSELKEMADKLGNATSHKGLNRSLIIDVSIDCMEVFQVFNSKNEVIQGSLDGVEERVSHCVRFEMMTTPGEEKGQRVLGSWQIIDIDDFLDGNQWH